MIVGWFIDTTLGSRIVIVALKQALRQREKNPCIIFNSERVSQYASKEVKSFPKEYDIMQSMSRKGNHYDNSAMESFSIL
jgi:transposase InsO family protein